MTCPSCEADVPAGRHCIRCGADLASAHQGFGANPKERAGLPYLVSTLFPALPRADMRAFRFVLGGGAVLVTALTLAGLFPLALTSAALLVPILTALYLWDVDVYEDQPWRVVGLTVGIGALAGVALGLVSETGLEGLRSGREDLLIGGVVIPLAAQLLALAGPIALLLPRARFNDVLDGATFGAVSAAALTAAMALTRGVSLLGDGLRPEGDTGEWLLRLAGLAVGAPVLAMCAAGGAAASLWVRFRAPLPDHTALGPLAHPAVAMPLAAALVVAGATTQILLPGWLWLIVLAVLDAIGLLWLRRVIHTGLRQQALEQQPGPPETCPECGVATPKHAYCGNCGTARSALPKGERRRLGALVVVPAVVLAAGIAATTAGAAVAEPEPLLPPCIRGEACGSPPSPPAELVAEREVDGGEAGWTGAYDAEAFDLQNADGGGYDLVAKSAPLTVRVRVTEGDDITGALDGERDRLSEEVLGLVDLDAPTQRIAGPMIGYRTADVMLLTGTVDTPQGPGDGLTAAVLGATDGQKTTTVTVTSTGKNEDRRRAVFGQADVVLQGFRWETTGPVAAAPDHRPSTSRRRTAPHPGRSAPSRPSRVTASLVLRPRRPRALAARAAGHGRPLTAAQIGRRFGPTDASLARVRRAMRAARLRPQPVAPQRTTLRVTGTARAVERAFGVRLLAAPGGRHHPDRPARVPRGLRAHVAAVSGLDTRAIARPAAFPSGGLRPVDARRAYDMDDRRLGQGETIAVLSLDSFDPADVEQYDRTVGIDSGPVEKVPVNGGTQPGPGQEEVNLDLDVIRGLVPRAKLLDYEAPNRAGAFADIMEQIVADGRAKIVSISWGRCDLTLPDAERAADDAQFTAAAAAGIAVFVASGDSGAYECERFDREDQRLSVSWPAASRHVIAVGGTTLRLGADRRREAEYGWESPLSNAGAGGGVAGSEPQADWQRGSTVTGVRNEFSTGRRQVPDVAAAADFRTGWLTVVRGEAEMFGGTSAAAPFWAAVAAVVREGLREADRRPPPNFARFLYQIAEKQGSRAFHDVVEGGNRFHDAGPGWDYATGLGTPDVGRLVEEAIVLGPRKN